MSERTNRAYKLDLIRREDCTAGMFPSLEPTDIRPFDLVAFGDIQSTKDNPEGMGVHFFIDDYRFERVWSNPEKYITRLADFGCVLTPDFSTYTDMPIPMQLWNVYRSRALGRIWQSLGLDVVPTLQWSTPDVSALSLAGLPSGGTVAVSTIGVRKDRDAMRAWVDGMRDALDRTQPTRILHYGPQILDDWGGAEVAYYVNPVIERFRLARERRKQLAAERQPQLEWSE